MPKLILSDVTNLGGNPVSAQQVINTNSDRIEAAVEKTLSRDGTSPNQMEADFDMNHHNILNAGTVYGDKFVIDGVEFEGTALWIISSGAPGGAVGKISDVYLDSLTGDVYGPKTVSGWGSVSANIKGPQGIQGPQGVQGIQGIQGLQGMQGPQGLQGPQGVQGVQGVKGDSFSPDAIGLTSDRVNYDEEPKGFSFLDSQTGYLYFKLSATSGDWSPGITFTTGPQGPVGPQGVQGPEGPQGVEGPQGPIGPAGVGVPTGGTAGQILTKNTGADYDTSWKDVVDARDFDTISVVQNTSVDPSVNFIRTAGYSAVGDGGGALYKRVATEPSHAGKVQSDDGTWWEIAEQEFNVRMFGAKGDGVTDDTAAIQGAIDALPARGGTVRIPGGRYSISSTIHIGDGNGGSTPSSKNGVKVIGDGIGVAVSGILVPTIITWNGSSTTNSMIDVRGQISDGCLKGIFLECRALCAGISMTSFSGFDLDMVKVVSPRANGLGLLIKGGTAPTGNYNIGNKFSRVFIALTEANSIGVMMDGVFASNNDTWLSRFDLVRVDMMAGATSAVGFWFKFVDSCTFIRCHSASYEPTATGAIFDALSNNTFPAGMHFIDCSLSNIVVYEDASNKIRKNYFSNHGTYDNEVIPDHPMLVGFTDTGLSFGPIGYASGTGGSVTQTTSKITPVTLNKLNGRIVMNNSSLSAGGLTSFVFNNSFLSTSDILVLNISGGAAYGSYDVSVSDVQAGLAVVSVRNVSAVALSESIEISFAVIKSFNS